MRTIDDIVHLKISGQSQLEKEIYETKNSKHSSDYFLLDEGAIHRNEITGEVEKTHPSSESWTEL